MIIGSRHTRPVPNNLPTGRRNERLTSIKSISKRVDGARGIPGFLYRRTVEAVAILCGILSLAVPLRAEVSEEKVMDVAVELACLCGDCPNRPLDECRCGHAGTQRNRIAEEFEKGKTKDQIIAGFVADFGQRIFVAPPKEGFNLMAWFMPFFGIFVGGYAVRSIMKGWSRAHTYGSTRTPAGSAVVSETDRAKLEKALGEQDT